MIATYMSENWTVHLGYIETILDQFFITSDNFGIARFQPPYLSIDAKLHSRGTTNEMQLAKISRVEKERRGVAPLSSLIYG